MGSLHFGRTRNELGETQGPYDGLRKVRADALELCDRARQLSETCLVDEAIDRSCLHGAVSMVSGLSTFVNTLQAQAADVVLVAQAARDRVKNALDVARNVNGQ